MNIIELPTEIIIKILGYLRVEDRLNVALVSKGLYNLLREKSFMLNIVLYVTPEELDIVNKASRFENLNALNVSNQDLVAYSECWSSLLMKLVECEIVNCKLSRKFLHDLLKNISKETKLRKLNLRNTGILLGRKKSDNLMFDYVEAIVKLMEVNFWGTNLLEVQHLKSAFKEFEVMGSLGRLKTLNLGCIDSVQWIEPEAFGKVLNKLEVLNIRNTVITAAQFNFFLDEMVNGTHLKILKMGNNYDYDYYDADDADVNGDQLAIALNKVVELELWPCEFRSKQMLAMLSRIGQEGSELRKLFLDEDTDRRLSATHDYVYPDLKRRLTNQISFNVLPY